MEAMRESWTDERLDDFRAETARSFDKIDTRFDKVDARFERMEARIDEKFDRLYQVILIFGGGSIVTFVVGFASLIVTQL
jgi:hypothetical protein